MSVDSQSCEEWGSVAAMTQAGEKTIFFSILLGLIFQILGQQDCMMGESDFCKKIETEPEETFYFGCIDPNATLFPHPQYCTLYIQCLEGNKGIEALKNLKLMRLPD